MFDRLQTLLPSVLALSIVALLVIPAVAAAQSGLPPTITMHPESAGPGATVEVTGLDFPADATITLGLTTPDGPLSLAAVTTTTGGLFRQVVTLPADATIGEWELLAQAATGASASFSFDAAAPVVGGQATTAAPPSGGNSFSDIMFMLIIASVLGVVITGVLFAYRLLQDERSQPGMGAADDLIWSNGSSKVAESQPTATSEPFWKSAAPRPESAPEPAGPEPSVAGEQEAPASA